MYIGRTQLRTQSVFVASMLAITGILTQTAFAQSTTRLSSNPHDMHDAFARHSSSINTPEEFANYVETNPGLRANYARHFGIPEDRVVSFFRHSLVPYMLPSAKSLTTYGVAKDGTIYPVKTRLPKGTQVWATREGVPVLKWNCSNPLVADLPGSKLTPPLEVATTASPILPEGDLTPTIEPNTFAVTDSPALPEVVTAPVATEPSAAFAFAVPTSDAGSASLPGIADVVQAAGPSGKDFLSALLIPALFAAGGHGSSSGSGETPPFLQPSVVPETNTFGLIGLGLPILGAVGLLARRRKLA